MNVSDRSDIYFVKTKKAITDNPRVRYQVFQKKVAILAGSQTMVDLFRAGDVPALIRGLSDGAKLNPGLPTHIIEGHLQDLVELETLYLGVLSEMTKVATNVRSVVEIANKKPVLFFPARFALPTSQFWHGYAAAIGGAIGCSTKTQMEGWSCALTGAELAGQDPSGTMPHAAIAACGGDTVEASLEMAKAFPDELIWVLVDFDNDCANTAVAVYERFKAAGMSHRIAGVRLDTSEKLVDKGVLEESAGQYGAFDNDVLRGVCIPLVEQVRHRLNGVGATNVKICVSGGFTPLKIATFESRQAPVDVYAVGEYCLSGSNPFTSDIVAMETVSSGWTPVGKVGRVLLPEPAGFKTLYDTITPK